MSKEKDKTPFNLSINREIKREMKIFCAENDEDVSAVTEELYKQFLEEHRKLKGSATYGAPKKKRKEKSSHTVL